MERKSHNLPLVHEGHSLPLAGAPGDGKDTLVLVMAAAGCSPTPRAGKYLHFWVRSTAHLEQSPLLPDFPSLTATAFEGIVARVISFSQYQVKVLLSIRWARGWNWPWTTESAQRGYGCTSTWANIHKRHKKLQLKGQYTRSLPTFQWASGPVMRQQALAPQVSQYTSETGHRSGFS